MGRRKSINNAITDDFNADYFQKVDILQNANNALDIEKAINNLINLRTYIVANFPEFIVSTTDIDYHIACGAYRVNNVKLLEQIVQQHYYNDYRFKILYQSFREMETANVWNNIVKANANNLEKTFVRSLSVVILTCVCLSLVFRK